MHCLKDLKPRNFFDKLVLFPCIRLFNLARGMVEKWVSAPLRRSHAKDRGFETRSFLSFVSRRTVRLRKVSRQEERERSGHAGVARREKRQAFESGERSTKKRKEDGSDEKKSD